MAVRQRCNAALAWQLLTQGKSARGASELCLWLALRLQWLVCMARANCCVAPEAGPSARNRLGAGLCIYEWNAHAIAALQWHKRIPLAHSYSINTYVSFRTQVNMLVCTIPRNVSKSMSGLLGVPVQSPSGLRQDAGQRAADLSACLGKHHTTVQS